MYMKSILDLKTEVKNEIEKSINSNLKCEIMAIQVSETMWPSIYGISVVFRNGHGKADALVKVDGDECKLLAPFKVEFNKKEEKK